MTMNESQKKIIGYSAIAMCVLTIISCIVWFFSIPAYADSFTTEPEPQSEPEVVYIDSLMEMRVLDGYAATPFSVPATNETAAEEASVSEESAEAEAVDEPEEEAVPQNLSENEYAIYTALRNAGLSKAGTAAVMGCMVKESNLRTTAENPNDGGYGLLQWTYSRKTDLLNWCYSAGLDASSVEGQVQFFVHELQSKYSKAARYSYPVYETLTSSDSVEDSLAMFFSHMEAGTNVPISASKVYCGNLTTLNLYQARLSAAYKYFA